MCRPMMFPDFMLVYSGTTSHMTALGEHVAEKRSVTTEIHFAEDSTVTATKMNVRKVVWIHKSGPTTISLPKTRVARKI